MNTQQIKIADLDKSPLNARKTVSKDGLDELKASILAHGLMQNLVVTAAGDGKFHVIAGSRRLTALQALQAEGKLPKDHAVPCQIADDENALELSIAENKVRHAMHPADEFEAFAALIEQGLSAEQAAQRFGVAEKHVLQRLKLSCVAPKLIAEYRAGKITLQCLEEFTITDDRKRQLAVYKGFDANWYEPGDIRAALTEKAVDATDKLVVFVGLDAYHAAGGKSRADLFGEDVYLEDAEVLNHLAKEKMDAEADKLRKAGWSWVEIAPERDWSFVNRCERMHPKGGKFTAEHMKQAGCYVCLSHQGKLEIERGLVRPEDKKKLAKAKVDKGEAAAKDDDNDSMPQALMRDLAAYRLGAAQAEIAKHPQIAFDLLVFKVAISCISLRGSYDGPDVSFRHSRGGLASESAREFIDNQMDAIEKTLPLDWMEADIEAEQFEQFRELEQDDKLRLLAYCVAATLQPKMADDDKDLSAYDIALSLTGGDVAAYWRPTKDNFLGRITREQLLEIGAHVFGKQWADARRNAKKGELVDVLHQAFAEPEKHGKTPEQIDKLKALLPVGMAFPASPEPKEGKKATRSSAAA